ncbi:hypothetical protein TNCT_63981 [Trichonephila clavata]|uniref:Uncharacterized protein n=1 Tax=Trichonephila clavata TaxID=2740835 RepID=A0A8X6KQU3_TRICU|nr:hypothetical protein TNCT_63981 [Trichonephila clavata]
MIFLFVRNCIKQEWMENNPNWDRVCLPFTLRTSSMPHCRGGAEKDSLHFFSKTDGMPRIFGTGHWDGRLKDVAGGAKASIFCGKK